jgi:hypothetical protein
MCVIRIFAFSAECLRYYILFAAVLAISTPALAEQGSIDCDILVVKVHETNTIPQVTIDPSWGIIRIAIPEFYCREPVEMWRDRALSWPVDIAHKSEASPVLNLPKNKVVEENLKKSERSNTNPVSEESLNPKNEFTPKLTATYPLKNSHNKKLPYRQSVELCDFKIEDTWSAGYHRIGDVEYLLSKIFTIDGNEDGVADNLSFIMVGADLSLLTIRYFDQKGKLTAREIPTLYFPSSMEVSKVCLDSISYGIPFKTLKKIEISPNLAAEMRDRLEGNGQLYSNIQKVDGSGVIFEAWLWLSAFFLSLGFVFLVFIDRNSNEGTENVSVTD